MHVLFRETHGLEENAAPQDLGQSPADLVVLSFSDSDLGAFAAACRGGQGALPSLRLANLAALMHPLSVDTYIERTLSGAKAILIRLIGGMPYWSYGLQQVEALARERGIALAVLPADGRPDERLDAASTVPVAVLRALAGLCDAGGADAARAALGVLAKAANIGAGQAEAYTPLPAFGLWHPTHGVVFLPNRHPREGGDPLMGSVRLLPPASRQMDPRLREDDEGGGEADQLSWARSGSPLVLIVFYRSYVAACDVEPFEALHAAFERAGFDTLSIFVPSLKAPDARAQVAQWVRDLGPAAIVNATAFSARDDHGRSPLDAAGVPVFQIALATAPRDAWASAERGLSPADLAMHVVLPELDGRVFVGVASFKQAEPRDEALGFARTVHRAEPQRIEAIVARVAGWIALAEKPLTERRVALVLSTYPGKAWQLAHAVGLDALASAEAIASDLGEPVDRLAERLQRDTLRWPLAAYRDALATLPKPLREALDAAWGEPDLDTSCRDGHFHFAALQSGKLLIALQPERGDPATREDSYHDIGRVPRHGYVAFYLWLKAQGIDALVHIGAHGTLEWLPGKAVALSDACWPEALTGGLPILYPFIVNDPGEAAQAKRRTGAVTIGHLPPALKAAGTGAGLGRIEALLDEFSNAVGLDPARRDRLQAAIRDEARSVGLEAELGLEGVTSSAEAIIRIDRFVCDVKEGQFGDGLHVFGRGACGDSERDGLFAGLAGKHVAAGPSGSPFRGRTDVLPTGRNLYTIDPRAVPSRAAHAQGIVLADELIRRHLQDHGEYPKGLVVDLWGSATMRTAGEEFAMALHLLGAAPVWDTASERVTGVEILPIAMLDRPRIDVTLRVSGLFRDAFPTLPQLFGQAVRALAARDEAPEWNPFAGKDAGARVYGPRPGSYGLGMGDAAETYTEDARRAAGEAWLAASDHAFDGRDALPDPEGLRARVAGADAFVHLQDLAETDLLLAADYAAHEAGFAAAKALSGGSAALYHLDARDPTRPVARPLTEEIARVVRARAANPGWIAGMRRHGFRGAAEIAATLDHLGAFAHLAAAVPPQLFDLYHDATLGDAAVRDFLARENPAALAAMEARFAALHAAGLWQTRRNSILAGLGGAA
jgi:cobaltochelatase CobN